MVRLDLDPHESRLLADAVRSQLSDLRYEISNTDRLDFRNELKAVKAVLSKTLSALETEEHGD